MSKILKKNDYVIVKLKDIIDSGSKEYIIGVTIDTSSIKIITEDEKLDISVIETNMYKDYKIGIIFELDSFIPISTTLRLFPKNHHSCKKNCSFYIKVNPYAKYKLNHKKDKIKICRKKNKVIEPLEMLAVVSRVDHVKKFIDLSIGGCYKLSSSCPRREKVN